MAKSPVWVVIFMNCLKTIVGIFDLLTLPLHLIIQKPWKKTRRNELVKVNKEVSDSSVCFTCNEPFTEEQELMYQNLATVTDLFDYAVKQFGEFRCQGLRKVYNEEEERQTDGRVFKKLVLGDYEWKTFNEVNERVINFGKGLHQLGLKPLDRIVILADTSPEWLIAALSCFNHKISIVTLYPTLGEDGIIHGILETEVTTIITSQDLLPKLKKVLPNTPLVKNVIYIERISRYSSDSTFFLETQNYKTFEKIENIGQTVSHDLNLEKPTRDDIAIIMYTSGSTGTPKAVLLSHKNIIHTTICSSLYDINQSDLYIAYLPLAHVLELQAECMVMVKGIPIGYSSPLTLTDKSSKIKRGCPGDVTLLKPTFMASVPMILERVKKGIIENIEKKNSLLRAIITYAIEYKSTFYEIGFDTPIINWLICSKMKKLMGGNLRIIGSGGAPLSPEVHRFVRSCFNVKLLIGYGLTETCSSNCTARDYDRNVGTVGWILPKCYLKLIPWEEGNYKPDDKPNPRGEIVIGGDCVSDGYFKNDTLSEEVFYEKDEIRWFKTGDIGEVLPNGSVKIIDRKKDIVKLQTGEYISLVKIETIVKELYIVDNVCIVANSFHSYVTALIVPNQSALSTLGEKLGKVNGNHNVFEHATLCNDKDIKMAVLKIILDHCKQRALCKFETPQKLLLCDEAWNPDSGVVTSTFKLKRKALELKFKKEIDEMFLRH